MLVWRVPETNLRVVLLQSSAGSKVSRPDPEATRSAVAPPCLPCHGDASSHRCLSFGNSATSPDVLVRVCFWSDSRCLRRAEMAGSSAARGEDEIISQLGSERNSWHPAHDGNTRCPIDSGMPRFFLWRAGSGTCQTGQEVKRDGRAPVYVWWKH